MQRLYMEAKHELNKTLQFLLESRKWEVMKQWTTYKVTDLQWPMAGNTEKRIHRRRIEEQCREVLSNRRGCEDTSDPEKIQKTI